MQLTGHLHTFTRPFDLTSSTFYLCPFFYQNNTDNTLPFCLSFVLPTMSLHLILQCHTYAILLLKYVLLKFGSYMHKEDSYVDQSVHAMMRNLLGLLLLIFSLNYAYLFLTKLLISAWVGFNGKWGFVLCTLVQSCA